MIPNLVYFHQYEKNLRKFASIFKKKFDLLKILGVVTSAKFNFFQMLIEVIHIFLYVILECILHHNM